MVSSPLRFEEALRHCEMIDQGRNQKPKGFKIKHALQVTLLLVIGIWLLYQVKNSHHKKKDYSALLGNKLVAIVDMGRKGNAGSNDQVGTDFHDKNSPNGDDDKLDGLTDEVLDNEVKEDDELDSQRKETLTNEEDGSDTENDLKISKKETENTEGLNSENDEVTKGSAGDTSLDPDETESSSIIVTGTHENISEVNGYQDENGIPPDGHESENSLYNETISDVVPVTMVEVTALGSNDLSEADTNEVTDKNGQNNSNMSSDDLSVEEEVSSEFANKYEKLSSNGTAEMTQEGNINLFEGSNSDLSQHGVEETEG